MPAVAADGETEPKLLSEPLSDSPTQTRRAHAARHRQTLMTVGW